MGFMMNGTCSHCGFVGQMPCVNDTVNMVTYCVCQKCGQVYQYNAYLVPLHKERPIKKGEDEK